MALSEFDIIATYFNKPGLSSNFQQDTHVPLGIGDDCAVLSIPEGKQLALSMDVLVADIHFPLKANSNLIAQRALAVNLSDLAAMGAIPLGFTLGLTLPEVSEQWLSDFSDGLSVSAQKYRCPLIGGDISKGPLSICIQVHGLVDIGKEMRRDGAKVGDKIFVTGCLGEAGLALDWLEGKLGDCTKKERSILERSYYQPEPRLEVGKACAGLASAAIDISDGLLADLGHIAQKSKVGVEIELSKVPVSLLVQSHKDDKEALEYALAAGDDYELILAVAPENVAKLEAEVGGCGVQLSCIGGVVREEGVFCLDRSGKQVDIDLKGYRHF